MSKLNKSETKPLYETTSHKNHMNGDSWDVSDPFFRLRMVAASSFLANQNIIMKMELLIQMFLSIKMHIMKTINVINILLKVLVYQFLSHRIIVKLKNNLKC